ncbi:DedA family protein [Rhizomonospora bruguierae]|uniref:DedA family protein n=1 Tax=Rhizomonospora bruguierae TaxID=1581705 RepID=UPI001BCE30DC|nr:VTT domain-containing protein [Micromonospora sp. NBRC 107566]
MTLPLDALASLLGVVAFGAVLPIVPTGAAVSAACVLAYHEEGRIITLLVILTGAAGAYLGDLVTFALARWGGVRLAHTLRWLRDPERVKPAAERLRDHDVSVLLVSRLLPGGRIPVLLAAAIAGVHSRRFVIANIPACLLWSATYAAIGLLGGAIFPKPWEGIVAALVLIVAVSQLVSWINRRRADREPSSAEAS